ncbi:hypothetical protein [Lapillicoccus jejuensis]|uniref:Parallel beta helix pectate lyase-like protein n=1 Tax=Lapillicoccus jejuensis TaxID=402171 RepID=A0A542E628_9MICO|nr:hypothetical protein [Lapillicoccus jejuensis]TQJ10788.1 hypothetical protein FB458_3927 [Lapillicoccus jejuensis]
MRTHLSRRLLTGAALLALTTGGALAGATSAPAAAPAPAGAPTATGPGSATWVDTVDQVTAPVARVGAVPPASQAGTTGATGYADPATPPLRVVPVSTSAGLTAALKAARPGDRISLAKGTYTGPFTVSVSGTQAHPVVVAPATGGVTLTASLHMRSCGAGGPDEDRTVSVTGGASHVVLQGLVIDGGLKIASQNADAVQNWQARAIRLGDWRTRRSAPGTASRDAVAARGQEHWFESTLGQSLGVSTDVQLIDNLVTRKGIFGRLVSYSVLSGNVVKDVACGTGPGIWLANYSNGNVVTGNLVTRVAASTYSHYMQEGIRLGNGSDYNAVVGNIVRDLPANGRGITTDQDASWNLLAENRVASVDIAFNEQMSGWGNVWRNNLARNARVAAFSYRMEDSKLTVPSRDTSSFDTTTSCNLVQGAPVGVQVGAMGGGTFTADQVGTVQLNRNVLGYWASAGNTWDGSSTPPGDTVTASLAGC